MYQETEFENSNTGSLSLGVNPTHKTLDTLLRRSQAQGGCPGAT